MLNFFKKKSQGEQVTLKVKGMHCTSCAMNIDGALEDTKGVFSANTSYAKAQVKIEYDPKKVTKKTLISVVTEQGYDVVE
jgi:copper chaperone CopZ